MIRVLAIAILALLLLDASSEVARVQGGRRDAAAAPGILRGVAMSSTPIEDEQAAGVVPRGREKSADAPAASESAWSEQLRATVDARLALIMENREKLVRAFIAETGLLPSQCELVETHTGFSTVVRVRRRGEP